MSELAALIALGLPERIAAGARAALGADAATVVASDPWSLLTVNGVRPEQVDAYARARLGAEARPEDRRRQAALLAWLLRRAGRDGHTVLPLGIVASALAAYGVEKPDTAVTEGTDRELVVATDEGVSLRAYAYAERQLAAAVSRAVQPPPAGLVVGSPEWVGRVLADAVTIVTSQPGRALDAAVRALVAGARDRGVPLSLIAPTAGSAARLRASIDAPVQVGAHLEAASPGLALVSDAHTLDVVRLAGLTRLLPGGAHVVLVGDRHALPPAGPGRPFADLAASGVVATYDTEPEHTEPDRVATIADLAACVARGVLPRISAADRQVVLMTTSNAEQAVSHAVRLATESIPRVFGIDPDDVMVLGPAHRGVAGVHALNAVLKAAINPGDGAAHGFDPGDRVVLTSEIEGPPVGPGDWGTVVGAVDGALQIDVHGQNVLITPPVGGRVRPARALTVARAAVGRWPACVLVLPAESAGLLSRALLRTAITRAEQHLSIVHAAGPAVAHAVVHGRERGRRTLLPTLLGPDPPKEQEVE